MNKLSTEDRAAILSALVEGSSVNATARMCGVSKVTVLRLLSDVGSFCADYHELTVRGLQTKRAQADELWSFCGCKEKAKKAGGQGHGDLWTSVVIDADTKLVISYHVGARDGQAARTLMLDLAERVKTRPFQLSTDAHGAYPPAVEAAFGGAVHFAQVVKKYAAERPDAARYSPARCTGCELVPVVGKPDMEHVSTSYVERQNLTMRMSMRRFTRLTNGYSKRVENHAYAVALHVLYVNFIRKHQTLKTTPAVAAGLAVRPMTMLELVEMVEREERLTGGRLTRYLPAKGA